MRNRSFLRGSELMSLDWVTLKLSSSAWNKAKDRPVLSFPWDPVSARFCTEAPRITARFLKIEFCLQWRESKWPKSKMFSEGKRKKWAKRKWIVQDSLFFSSFLSLSCPFLHGVSSVWLKSSYSEGAQTSDCGEVKKSVALIRWK